MVCTIHTENTLLMIAYLRSFRTTQYTYVFRLVLCVLLMLSLLVALVSATAGNFFVSAALGFTC